MRILLDTNIFIPLEDSAAILDSSFSDFIKLCNLHSHHILVHPRSIEDLGRDKDKDRKLSMLSRIQKYEMLEAVDSFSKEIMEKYNITQTKENDEVDNAILAAVLHNAVHLLVTEDRGIHKKALKLGIAESVLYLQQVVSILKRLHPVEREVFHPNLQNHPLHQINLEDSFFDSLRADYEGFNDWYKKSAAEGRKAWINIDKSLNSINSILIYKPEISEPITCDYKSLPNQSIKISTFKVGESVRGRKVGELLFKTIFEYAYKNSYSWVYLTIHPEKHEFLKDMCIDLGFYEYGIDIKSERDEVYVKQIGLQDKRPYTTEVFEFYRRYSPTLLCKNVTKYIIPIKNLYHKILFPDNQRIQNLFEEDNIPGNTLKKAYLSHAQLNEMKRGDIVLFYRTVDEKRLTTLAIVEDYFISQDSDYIASRVAKRTVYSFDSIIEMTKRSTKVLLFRQVNHFENRSINYTWMHLNKIVRGPIQSITKISDEAFQKVMEKENAKNCTDIN